MSAQPDVSAAPSSAPPPSPSLLVTAELSAYYAALVSAQPSLSSVLPSTSPTVGRYLRSSTALQPSTVIFHEAAVLCASDDPSVCVACHGRHAVGGVPCEVFGRYRQLRGLVNSVASAASAAGYGESRGLLVADWLIHVQDSKEAERTQRLSRAEDSTANPAPSPSLSLARSFARPPPSPPSFSLPNGHADGQRGTQQPLPRTSSPPIQQPPAAPAAAAAAPTIPSLHSLALSAIFSLDAGPPSVSAVHSAFASEVWHLLPLHLRRLISVSSLTRLLCVLELNSHELVDEAGGRGEGLFPFFALIQHSCHENCAFTALSSHHAHAPSTPTPSSSSPPSVSVSCLRPISPGSALSINYAPPYLPTSMRREYLRLHYHFHCTCPLCGGQLPDRCRAFVCGGCGEVVWVWGEGRVEDGVKGWRCSDPACAVEVTEAQVSRWREAEAYLEEEVRRLMQQAEDAEKSTAAHERSSQLKDREREKGQRRSGEQLSHLQLLLQRFLVSASDAISKDRFTAPVEAEVEAETGAGEEAVSERDTADEPPMLSKSQLKNRRRRAKQRQRQAQIPSASSPLSSVPIRSELLSVVHSSHFHVHALLDLLCQARAEAGEWSAAVQAARVRLANTQLLNEGEMHWLEAVEWSALAALYREMGDEAASKAATAQCYAINRACFGDAAAAT